METPTFRTRPWRTLCRTRWLPAALATLWLLHTADSMNGSHVCMEKQKYNVTKRIKYRAPMSVRTYEWCLAVPPRCSRWHTEMRDLTRLETEERTLEVAVCCPGFSMKAAVCQPKCPSGKMGHNCTEHCPKSRWGPSCSKECEECPAHASCSPYTGVCVCDDDWKGERCEISTENTTTSKSAPNNLLTTSTLSPIQSMPSTIAVLSTTSAKHIETTPSTVTHETATLPMRTTKQTMAVTTENTKITVKLSEVSQTTENTLDNVLNSNNFTIIVDDDKDRLNENYFPTTKKNQWSVTDASSSIISDENIHEEVTVRTTITDVITVPKLTTPQVLSTAKTTVNNRQSTKSDNQTIAVTNNKQKEIWIKPTQKGDSILIEPKNKTATMTTSQKNRNINIYHLSKEQTTPRTIVVSIIPTSLDHTTVFKRITLSMNEHKPILKHLPYITNNGNDSSIWKVKSVKHPNERIFRTEHPTIKRNALSTASTIIFNRTTAVPSNFYPSRKHNITNDDNITITPKHELIANYSNAKQNAFTESSKRAHRTSFLSTLTKTATLSTKSTTKSLPSFSSSTTSKFLTTVSASYSSTRLSALNTRKQNSTYKIHTTRILPTYTTTSPSIKLNNSLPTTLRFESDKSIVKHLRVATVERNKSSTPNTTTVEDVTLIAKTSKQVTKADIGNIEGSTEAKLTTTNHKLETNQEPTNATELFEDEVFGVLTEPEHITAVVDGGTERNTDNLLSVLSIVGGVMFATITVAVVIVMMERCRRARYEDLVKANEARRAMEEEEPPPYVSSIFHTPLPDPPTAEKSHYLPISTLDRNLKQFMRPVAVHSISPVMMDNFREILECHYDHLPPRRSHISFRSDTLSCHFRNSTTPSIEYPGELCSRQSSTSEKKLPVTEHSVETLKLEGVVETLDPTTTEPLYAEISCWRPASQHAIEVVNLNGEAVTEL